MSDGFVVGKGLFAVVDRSLSTALDGPAESDGRDGFVIGLSRDTT
jgi:hypothetical protein